MMQRSSSDSDSNSQNRRNSTVSSSLSSQSSLISQSSRATTSSSFAGTLRVSGTNATTPRFRLSSSNLDLPPPIEEVPAPKHVIPSLIENSSEEVERQVSEEELQSLETKTKNVEQQMVHLSTCVKHLTDELAMEQTTNRLLHSHVNTAFNMLKKSGGPAASAAADAAAASQAVRRVGWSRTPGAAALREGWNDNDAPDMQQLRHDNNRLSQLLEEERAARIEMRSQYEQQLRLLRNHLSQREKPQVDRKKLQQSIDRAVTHYWELAKEAVQLAKEERTKRNEEQKKMRRIAEDACHAFEKSLKQQTRKALEEYRNLAVEAHDAAQRERQELSKEYNNLKSSAQRDVSQFEAAVVREAERRVSACRKAQEKLEATMIDNAFKSQKAIDDICDNVEQKCLEFERVLMGKTLQVLWEHGVDKNEVELRQLLSSAGGVPLREDAINQQLRKEELERRIKEARAAAAESSEYAMEPMVF